MAQRSTEVADEATRLLADPTRYKIFCRAIGSGEQGLTTADVAGIFGLHPNVARMHLEKLARAGLLISRTRKTGSGGRPARVYHVGEAVSCQYPPRDYQLLAEITLTAIEEGADVSRIARKLGKNIGSRSLEKAGIEPDSATVEQLVENLHRVMQDQGMFAHIECPARGVLNVSVLNCVFRELTARHAGLICRMHNEMFMGMCESHFGPVAIKQGQMELAKGGLSCRYSVKLAS